MRVGGEMAAIQGYGHVESGEQDILRILGGESDKK
jgi:hypothetical protein